MSTESHEEPTRSTESVEDAADRHYQAGRQACASSMLSSLLHDLEPEQRPLARMVEQASRARAQLRTLCADHGDNDWDDNLDLADVIEEHLGRYLQETTR